MGIAGLDTRANVRPSYRVTTTISSKGQMVIPRQVRERLEIRPGDGFLLFELANGDILLRRWRPPKRSLAWHLRRMRGLELDRNRERVREVAW
jgi:AbrB family looped-hinge helix DNA binding protein